MIIILEGLSHLFQTRWLLMGSSIILASSQMDRIITGSQTLGAVLIKDRITGITFLISTNLIPNKIPHRALDSTQTTTSRCNSLLSRRNRTRKNLSLNSLVPKNQANTLHLTTSFHSSMSAHLIIDAPVSCKKDSKIRELPWMRSKDTASVS